MKEYEEKAEKIKSIPEEVIEDAAKMIAEEVLKHEL